MIKKKEILSVGALLGAIICFSILVFWYSPEKIIESIGIENAYITLLLLAFLGGTSIFVPFPYYLLTLSLGAAGLNPLILGVCAGIGTLVGDSLSYYLAYRGREVVPSHVSERFTKMFDWVMHKHPKYIMIFVYFYAGFTPLSDDFILIPAGLIRYPFIPLAIGFFLGKITFNILLALAGLYGWEMWGNW